MHGGELDGIGKFLMVIHWPYRLFPQLPGSLVASSQTCYDLVGAVGEETGV